MPAWKAIDSVKGYLRVRGRDRKRHRINRACWETYNGPIPAGYDIHHIDGNRRINEIVNLDCIPHGDHTSLHRTGRKRMDENVRQELHWMLDRIIDADAGTSIWFSLSRAHDKTFTLRVGQGIREYMERDYWSRIKDVVFYIKDAETLAATDE